MIVALEMSWPGEVGIVMLLVGMVELKLKICSRPGVHAAGLLLVARPFALLHG
jgi:hypothetical protein